MAARNSNVVARASTGERVLTEAARLFRTKGYSATTMRELAAALDVNKATLYHYIGGKEDLLYQLSIESLERITTDVSRAIALESDPLSRLVSAIKAHINTMLADRDKHATMLNELRALSGERATDVVELRDRYESLIRALLQEGLDRGLIRSDLGSVKYLTLALLNLLNWTIFWFEPDGELTPADLGEIFASIYLLGVTNDAALVPQPVGEAREENGRRG
jgi:AcrR family transcriptional regulator